jgi:dTDP-4-amino-4,6-dideoxygalactose transaminase
LNSCSAALHLALLASGLARRRSHHHAPDLLRNGQRHHSRRCDAGAGHIDPETLNIDPAQVRARLTPRTRAIVPVHFAGRPCEMDAPMSIACDRKLKVVEGCAHAIETQYRGRSVGTIGDFGVTKNVITGEGGMVLARWEEDAAAIKVLGLHGMTKDAWKRFGDEGFKHYLVVAAGFKYNMMDLQAAIGLSNWRALEAYWQRRK